MLPPIVLWFGQYSDEHSIAGVSSICPQPEFPRIWLALHQIAISVGADDLHAVAEVARDGVGGAGSAPADRIGIRVITIDEHSIAGVSVDPVALHQVVVRLDINADAAVEAGDAQPRDCAPVGASGKRQALDLDDRPPE